MGPVISKNGNENLSTSFFGKKESVNYINQGVQATELHGRFYSEKEIHQFVDKVVTDLVQRGWDDRERFQIELSMIESIHNALEHGNNNDPQRPVEVFGMLTDKMFFLQVHDDGEGFDPRDILDTRKEENITSSHGRGIIIMESTMNEVAFNRTGNTIMLSYMREDEK